MKKNEIIETEKGSLIVPNWDEIDRLRKIIDKTITESDVSTADALTCLCIYSTEIAYNYNISKHEFLSRLSSWWEELDAKRERIKKEKIK